MMKQGLPILFIAGFLVSCGTSENADKSESTDPKNHDYVYSVDVKTLTDEEYPDNNDIESRIFDWNDYKHHSLNVIRNDVHDFDLMFLPENNSSDTLVLSNLDLLAWIPTIPDHVTDPYLQHIAIMNAEWNRHQVKLGPDHYSFLGGNKESLNTSRVDLARNCLNSCAWEIITFTDSLGKKRPMYHGWFNFPHDLYEELFDEVNKGHVKFSDYKEYLDEYTHPESKAVNLEHLRSVENERTVKFSSLNELPYPKTGARKSKYKNIVYPTEPLVINDFLNDSTQFSTFQWPGFYDTSDPRSTELGKIRNPLEVKVRNTISNNAYRDECYEIEVSFKDVDSDTITKVVIGGVKKSEIPILALQDYNKGFKYPMGIGNHPFYEGYHKAVSNDIKLSPYFGFILTEEGEWIDSHYFGIDGPLLHFDDKNPDLLHFWLLSFERHAMVTHLTFELD